MKTIVFIGTQKSGSSRDAIKIADRLGYHTVLLTNRQSHMQQKEAFPDVKEMIYCDIDDAYVLKQIITDLIESGKEIMTILSFMDRYVYYASKLADEFGVGVFSTDAIYKMNNKYLSRQCIKDTPHSPMFQVIERGSVYSIDEIKRKLPFIMKKPKSTGSREVYLLKTYSQFLETMDEMFSDGSCSRIIIEEYLLGPQYLVETIVKDGKVNIVACIEQDVSYQHHHFIVTGYHFKHHLSFRKMEEVQKVVEKIISCHGMENGSCHLEMRFVNNEWKLIEINPRISGGAMNHFILYGLGINLVEQIINLALKNQLELTPKFKLYTSMEHITLSYSGKLLSVTGRNRAEKSRGVIEVFIKPRKGSFIHPPNSMGNRYAYVIANGYSEIDAKLNTKEAARKIEFHILKE